MHPPGLQTGSRTMSLLRPLNGVRMAQMRHCSLGAVAEEVLMPLERICLPFRFRLRWVSSHPIHSGVNHYQAL